MKKSIIVFCFTLFVANFLIGQGFSWAPDAPAGSSTDCSDVALPLESLTNITGDGISMLWKLERGAIPRDWKFQVCDSNLCYEDTNECPPGNTNEFIKDQSTGAYKITASPEGANGAGIVNFVLFNATDTSDVFATIPFDFDISGCTVSNDEIEEVTKISIAPNPATDFINVSVEDLPSGTMVYSITDQMGRTLSRKFIENSDSSRNIALSTVDLQSGIYYFTLAIGTKRFTSNFNVIK